MGDDRKQGIERDSSDFFLILIDVRDKRQADGFIGVEHHQRIIVGDVFADFLNVGGDHLRHGKFRGDERGQIAVIGQIPFDLFDVLTEDDGIVCRMRAHHRIQFIVVLDGFMLRNVHGIEPVEPLLYGRGVRRRA